LREIKETAYRGPYLGGNGTEVVVKINSQASKPCTPDVFDVLDGCHRDILGHLDKLMALVSQSELKHQMGKAAARRVR
jgi:hypothetical protein